MRSHDIDTSTDCQKNPDLSTEDIVQINQVLSAYGYATDTRTLDWGEVFTDDGVLDMTELLIGRREGLAAHRASPGPEQKALAFAASAHQHLYLCGKRSGKGS
jgi:hypothetical protein